MYSCGTDSATVPGRTTSAANTRPEQQQRVQTAAHTRAGRANARKHKQFQCERHGASDSGSGARKFEEPGRSSAGRQGPTRISGTHRTSGIESEADAQGASTRLTGAYRRAGHHSRHTERRAREGTGEQRSDTGTAQAPRAVRAQVRVSWQHSLTWSGTDHAYTHAAHTRAHASVHTREQATTRGRWRARQVSA